MKFREQSPGQLSTSPIPVGKRVNQAGVESNIIATIAKRNFVISYAADRRKNWRSTFIVPVRRDALVASAELEWINKPDRPDPTSGSLRRPCRRGMPVMPADAEWIIQPGAVDPTSGSLRKENWRKHGRRLCERLPPVEYVAQFWRELLIGQWVHPPHWPGPTP